nr:50S ribosomal protein L35 [Cavernulicola chilensis]
MKQKIKPRKSCVKRFLITGNHKVLHHKFTPRKHKSLKIVKSHRVTQMIPFLVRKS